MAALTVEETSRRVGGSLADMTLNAAAAGGDTVANDGRVCLVIANGSGSSVTVTITGGTDPISGLGYDDTAVAIAAGDTAFLGPFPVDQYTATLAIAYSAATSVTVGVVRPIGFAASRAT